MKSFFSLLFVACLTGCAGYSTVGVQGGIGPYGNVRASGGGRMHHPCEPVRAQGLMNWATELASPYQRREAHVANDNGRVHCYSSESAGSAKGEDPRRVFPLSVPAQSMMVR